MFFFGWMPKGLLTFPPRITEPKTTHWNANKAAEMEDWEGRNRHHPMYMGVEPKIGVEFYPKMDGENNGKPYEQMDDLGENTPIFGNIHICRVSVSRVLSSV